MELAEKIRALAGRIEKQRASVVTEEATKTAFIMPFLSALGYDVFDPHIVVPEFTADVGLKKGEKVDYAIKINDRIAMLIECKPCGTNLGQAQMSQLYRYFHVTDARFAILSNGIEYWFYTDLDEANKMDQRPFFRFRLLDYRVDDLAELSKFTATAFDEATILSTASNLKYSSAIKTELLREFDEPSEDMVRLLVSRVFDGNITQKVRAEFAPLVAIAFKDAIRDRVSDRLATALEVTSGNTVFTASGATALQSVTAPETSDAEDAEVVTTDEEIEAFHIVKAIVRSVVRAERVVMRDAKSYCAILLDDNNRKPLVRFHFNSKSVKYISLFDESRTEDRVKINGIDDIYDYADRLRATAASYSGKKAVPA